MKIFFSTILATFFLYGVNVQADNLPQGELLFIQLTSPGKGELMLLDIPSGKIHQVGHSGSRADYIPSWSGDGKKMVFGSYQQGGWHVWVANADGSQAKRLSNYPNYNTSYYEFDPALSPDAKYAVFNHAGDLMKVELTKLIPIRITPKNNGIGESSPSFSPDGKNIAIAAENDKDKGRDIYILDNKGSNLKRLTQDQGRNHAPVWSPNGQNILFYSDRNGSMELYEMNADGSQVQPFFSTEQLKVAGFKLTNYIDPWSNTWGPIEQYRASYSPDGKWISFARDIDEDREIFIAKRDGSAIHRLTHRQGLDVATMNVRFDVVN